MSDELGSHATGLPAQIEVLVGHEPGLRSALSEDDDFSSVAAVVASTDSTAAVQELHRLGRVDLSLDGAVDHPCFRDSIKTRVLDR
jgi:hypothetical protein